jgi:hypothetical protein
LRHIFHTFAEILYKKMKRISKLLLVGFMALGFALVVSSCAKDDDKCDDDCKKECCAKDEKCTEECGDKCEHKKHECGEECEKDGCKHGEKAHACGDDCKANGCEHHKTETNDVDTSGSAKVEGSDAQAHVCNDECHANGCTAKS